MPHDISLYEGFLVSRHGGIPGVTLFDSGKPGKTFGLLAVTHGNEPVGLEAFAAFRERLAPRLAAGRVFLVAVNIGAYRAYAAQEDPHAFRFLDRNMNRASKLVGDPSREGRRVDELRPLLSTFDVLLDLHSVPVGDEVIGIADARAAQVARRVFDAQSVLLEKDTGATGSMAAIVHRAGGEGFGLECGNHVSRAAFERAMSNVERFLAYAGAIDAPIPEVAAPDMFRFRNEIRPKHADFRFVRVFRNFDRVAPGETYATEAGGPLVNDSGHELRVVFAPPKFTLGDGAGFLLDPA